MRENERVHLENVQLRAQLDRVSGGSSMDTSTHMVPPSNYAPHAPAPQQLPPLRMNSGGPDSMSGVQYQQVQHDPRANGMFSVPRKINPD